MSISIPLVQLKRELKEKVLKNIGLRLQDRKHLVRISSLIQLDRKTRYMIAVVLALFLIASVTTYGINSCYGDWEITQVCNNEATSKYFIEKYKSDNKRKSHIATTTRKKNKMIEVKGGTFIMGCLDERDGDCLDKASTYEVTLESFYIGKYEVTNEEYCIFLNDKGNQEEGGVTWVDLDGESENIVCGIEERNGKYRVKAGQKRLPMVYVSWYGAQAYANWLSEKTGKTYKLPSTAQWEYAARGGVESKGYKYAGSNDIKEVAWYTENSGRRTHAVGTRNKPNELGIYDMTGNVYEWCEDTLFDKDSELATDYIRVIRGGSLFNEIHYCRSASVLGGFTKKQCNYYGFRLVRI